MTVRAFVVALFLFFALMAWVVAAHAAVLFFSGFETGDLAEWTNAVSTPTVNSGTLDGCTTLTGNYYMHVSTNVGFVEDAASTTAVNGTQNWVRFAIQIDAAPAAISPFLVMRDAGDVNNIFSYRIGTDRKISWAYNTRTGAAIATGTTVLATGTWYRFETTMLEAGSSTGGVEWKLYDATNALLETVTSFGTTTNTLGAMGLMYLGSMTFVNVGLTHICFEDVIVRDDHYAGPGGSIARQGIAGSPTYTAWTKNSCTSSLIENCWSQTPFNATPNATSTVSGDAQTMLAHSLSTTQTGHGSTVITSLSPLNACKVVEVGRSTPASSFKIRRRLGGVDTDTTRTLPTSFVATTNAGGGRDDCCWTDTLTNINAAEIGVVQNANTVTEEIEDMWIMCDYLLITTPPRHRVISP